MASISNEMKSSTDEKNRENSWFLLFLAERRAKQENHWLYFYCSNFHVPSRRIKCNIFCSVPQDLFRRKAFCYFFSQKLWSVETKFNRSWTFCCFRRDPSKKSMRHELKIYSAIFFHITSQFSFFLQSHIWVDKENGTHQWDLNPQLSFYLKCVIGRGDAAIEDHFFRDRLLPAS